MSREKTVGRCDQSLEPGLMANDIKVTPDTVVLLLLLVLVISKTVLVRMGQVKVLTPLTREMCVWNV